MAKGARDDIPCTKPHEKESTCCGITVPIWRRRQHFPGVCQLVSYLLSPNSTFFYKRAYERSKMDRG